MSKNFDISFSIGMILSPIVIILFVHHQITSQKGYFGTEYVPPSIENCYRLAGPIIDIPGAVKERRTNYITNLE